MTDVYVGWVWFYSCIQCFTSLFCGPNGFLFFFLPAPWPSLSQCFLLALSMRDSGHVGLSPFPFWEFTSMQNLFFLHDSLRGHKSQSQTPLSPFSSLSFGLPHSKEIGLLSRSLGSSASIQKMFCWNCSTCKYCFHIFGA